MNNPWSSASKDILQAITLFPDYPIYFVINNCEMLDPEEYGTTFHYKHMVEIGAITGWDGGVYCDEESLRDDIISSIWDFSMSEGENYRAVDRIVESQRWEPCILIYTGA